MLVRVMFFAPSDHLLLDHIESKRRRGKTDSFHCYDSQGTEVHVPLVTDQLAVETMDSLLRSMRSMR